MSYFLRRERLCGQGDVTEATFILFVLAVEYGSRVIAGCGNIYPRSEFNRILA